VTTNFATNLHLGNLNGGIKVVTIKVSNKHGRLRKYWENVGTITTLAMGFVNTGDMETTNTDDTPECSALTNNVKRETVTRASNRVKAIVVIVVMICTCWPSVVTFDTMLNTSEDFDDSSVISL